MVARRGRRSEHAVVARRGWRTTAHGLANGDGDVAPPNEDAGGVGTSSEAAVALANMDMAPIVMECAMTRAKSDGCSMPSSMPSSMPIVMECATTTWVTWCACWGRAPHARGGRPGGAMAAAAMAAARCVRSTGLRAGVTPPRCSC